MAVSEQVSGLGEGAPHCNGTAGSNGIVKDEVFDAAVTGAKGD